MFTSIQLLDDTVLVWLALHREAWLTSVMLGATALAATFAVMLVSLCVILMLRMRRHHAAFVGFVFSITTANLAVFVIKEWVGRLRPPDSIQVYQETGYSFPSGHTVNALVLYAFLAYLGWHILPRRWRAPLVAASMGIIAAVAFSRLYLGVHYLSDVIGGFVVGTVFLIPGILFAHRDFTRRKKKPFSWIDR